MTDSTGGRYNFKNLFRLYESNKIIMISQIYNDYSLLEIIVV